MIRFGSVCSGIEAASVAWNPLGWEAAWLSEIEPFPSALLEHHYPEVPNLGDMTALTERILSGDVEAPDVFCGGTPCQAFSVAGKRQSLDDERGNLSLTFCEIANAIDDIRHRQGKQPSVIFWENVHGVLNTKDNAFGCFLGELAGESCALEPSRGRWTNAGFVLGPKRAIAWRVLDAQYFGVAQRRRRVFVVASARDGFDPEKVLFEFDGVRRDTAPSREAGQETTGNAGEGTESTGFRKLTFESYAQDETASTMMARDYKSYTDLVAFNSRQDPVSGDVFGALDTRSPQAQAVVYPLNSMTMLGRPSDDLKPRMGSGIGKPTDPQNTLSAAHHHAVAIAGNIIGRRLHNGGNGNGFDDSGVCYTLTTVDRHAVACRQATAAFKAVQGASAGSIGYEEEISPTLTSADSGSNRTPALPQASAYRTETAVRRLTPVECERLMGFPDSYTQIPWRNKPKEECPDGHRYKALGNSWAVPVVRWIGERIAKQIKG